MDNETEKLNPIDGIKGVGRVLRMAEMTKLLGLSRATIYNRLNTKSKYYDSMFPKHIRLGLGSVGWLERDVLAWLASRPQGFMNIAHKE